MRRLTAALVLAAITAIITTAPASAKPSTCTAMAIVTIKQPTPLKPGVVSTTVSGKQTTRYVVLTYRASPSGGCDSIPATPHKHLLTSSTLPYSEPYTGSNGGRQVHVSSPVILTTCTPRRVAGEEICQ